MSGGTENQMKHFLFKISARRALDYAELFGRCHTLTVDKRWTDLAKTLFQLGELEDTFGSKLLAF